MSTITGPAAGDAKVVYLGNLDRKVSEDQVKAFAASTGGRVESVAVRARYAYITYASEGDASAAVAALNGKKLGDRDVRVEKSLPTEERDARRAARPPREPRAPRTKAAAPASSSPSGEVKYYDRKVIVKGLPRDMDSDAVKNAFSTCGSVLKVRLARGLAHVSFEDEDGATKAVGLTGTTFGERSIVVEKERMRKRGAGGKAATATKATATTAAAAPREQRRVRVDDLAEGTTGDQLKAFFASTGRVVNAKVIADRNHGFVLFEDGAQAQKALTLSGSSLSGATVTVTLDARTRKPARAAAEGGAGRRRAAGEEEREPRDFSNTVFVGGLDSTKSDESTVRAAFGAYGAVQSVDLIARGRAAYVRYTTEAPVSVAVAALNGSQPEYAIKPLRVEAATGRTKRPTRGRRGPRRSPKATA